MHSANRDMVEVAAREYDIPHDFEQVNIELAARLIAPFCRDRKVLEVGCGTCEMSRLLVPESGSFAIVEPAASFAKQARRSFGDRVRVYGCFLDEIAQPEPFDVIVMASLLQHVEDPPALLATVRRFCAPDTVLLATVPHVNSLHRRLGVMAGMLKEVHEDTPRNVRYRQFGKFDREILSTLFEDAGFTVRDCFGYMLKPFSSEQMQALDLEPAMIDALFRMGRQYPEFSSQLFLHATPKPEETP